MVGGGGQRLLSFLPYGPSASGPILTSTAIPSIYPIVSSLVPGGFTLTSPPTPVATSVGGGSGQITTTSLSTVVVTKTSTITSCAPTLTDCPAGLPATSTYTETQTSTILSCEGGCTGPAPAGAKDICVARRRRRAVVNGVLAN